MKKVIIFVICMIALGFTIFLLPSAINSYSNPSATEISESASAPIEEDLQTELQTQEESMTRAETKTEIETESQTQTLAQTQTRTPLPSQNIQSENNNPKVTESADQVTTPIPTPATPESNPSISSAKQEMLDLINAERAKAGVSPLKANAQLMEVAQLKAADMVENNYFSHTSPTWGSPFEMLDALGIAHRGAAENISGNSSVEAAHIALMNSERHSINILNSSYSYIGIGIMDSPKYGYVFVQIFIGQ